MTHKFDPLDTSQVFVWWFRWFWCSALRGWSWLSSVFFIFSSSLFSSSLLLLGNIWRWIGRLGTGIESFIRCWFDLSLLCDWAHLVRSMILLWFVMFLDNFADYCLRLLTFSSKNEVIEVIWGHFCFLWAVCGRRRVNCVNAMWLS